jgi:hypothetical protein
VVVIDVVCCDDVSCLCRAGRVTVSVVKQRHSLCVAVPRGAWRVRVRVGRAVARTSAGKAAATACGYPAYTLSVQYDLLHR